MHFLTASLTDMIIDCLFLADLALFYRILLNYFLITNLIVTNRPKSVDQKAERMCEMFHLLLIDELNSKALLFLAIAYVAIREMVFFFDRFPYVFASLAFGLHWLAKLMHPHPALVTHFNKIEKFTVITETSRTTRFK